MTEQDYSPGRELADYPRPSLAVDVAAFTYSRAFKELKLLVIPADDGGYRLPGSFVQRDEQLRDAVTRTMATKVGIKSNRATLLDVFDTPGRDPRGWVVTVAHLLVVPEEDVSLPATYGARWISVEPRPRLQGDHDEIVHVALEKLRKEYEIDQRIVKEGSETMLRTSIPRNVYAGKPDPEGFFSKEFTLRELQTLHETVASRPFLSPRLSVMTMYSAPSSGAMSSSPGRSPRTSSATGTLRDTFRRLMEPQLEPIGTNEGQLGSRGAPSRTWIVAD
jgi:ADP-ribose pyrophosphatase YjhB (NUDIX family)